MLRQKAECFFWYRPTQVVPEQRPLNGCCCCSYHDAAAHDYCYLHLSIKSDLQMLVINIYVSKKNFILRGVQIFAETVLFCYMLVNTTP